MLIDVVTLFPSQVEDFLNYSIIKRAIQDKKVEIAFHDLRKWAVDERGSVDEKPYGGGTGMILRVEPVFHAIRELRQWYDERPARKKLLGQTGNLKKELVVIFDARGEKYSQQKAFDFSKLEHLVLICGHYEGFDERILKYVDLSLSIGDFVLTGGEIPALVVIDSVVRLLPGVLKPGVVEEESYSKERKISRSQDSKIPKNDLEYPQYTRPEEFEGQKVPEVLLSGDHKRVEEWRKGKW